MAVVFLIGILGQPFELFNRAPIHLVERENTVSVCVRVCVCVCVRVCVRAGGICRLALLFSLFLLLFSQA